MNDVMRRFLNGSSLIVWVPVFKKENGFQVSFCMYQILVWFVRWLYLDYYYLMIGTGKSTGVVSTEQVGQKYVHCSKSSAKWKRLDLMGSRKLSYLSRSDQTCAHLNNYIKIRSALKKFPWVRFFLVYCVIFGGGGYE